MTPNSQREIRLKRAKARQERLFRRNRDEALGSYSGFLKHFSTEPEPARHQRYLIDKLDQVAKGEIRRLMIFMPPGSAKSYYASVMFPPYWLERNPRKLVIGASHSGDLAEDFGQAVRNTVGDEKYQRFFGTTLVKDSKAKAKWRTTKRSTYYAVGVRGSVTGRRGDLGIIDDPVKDRKEADSEAIQKDVFEWYKSAFRTRLKPNGAIIIIQTRWSENDLSGRILPDDYAGESGPVDSKQGETWEVVNLPMEAKHNDALGRKKGELLWPAWFTPDWVVTEKKSQGPRNWNALFQQDPTPNSGEYYERSDFRWYDRKPKHLSMYMAGDYAVGEDAEHDFSEFGVFGVDPSDDIYICDWQRDKLDSLELVDAVLDMVELHKPRELIGETGVIRKAIEPILKRRMRERRVYVPLKWLTHSAGDKVAMGRSFQALTQQNRIYFPRKDWAESLISQLVKFPGGKHDDGADTCALFGRRINKVWAAKKPEVKRKSTVVKGTQELTMADLGAKRYG